MYIYIFVYNLSLFLIFSTLTQCVNTNFKTIYSFSDFKYNFFFTTLCAVSLFSIAGVPPFIGFFSKILILVALINSNFFFFYSFFFMLLFFGLYFYLQNIRFLYSTGSRHITYSFLKHLRLSTLYVYNTLFIVFFVIFGFIFFDDCFLFFLWLFS